MEKSSLNVAVVAAESPGTLVSGHAETLNPKSWSIPITPFLHPAGALQDPISP